jgi:hypothetical protein
MTENSAYFTFPEEAPPEEEVEVWDAPHDHESTGIAVELPIVSENVELAPNAWGRTVAAEADLPTKLAKPKATSAIATTAVATTTPSRPHGVALQVFSIIAPPAHCGGRRCAEHKSVVPGAPG